MSLENIGIPNSFYKASTSKIKNLSSDQYEKLGAWAKKPSGNCVIFGNTGRGKTYAAVATMYYFLEAKHIPWFDQRFVDISDLNQQWLTNIQEPVLNSNKAYVLKNCKVVVFDDLGTRKPSDGFLDYLFTIINHRCNNSELITIYTTNLIAKEFNEIMGPRIVSRISDGLILEFKGSDLRDAKNSKIEPLHRNKIESRCV